MPLKDRNDRLAYNRKHYIENKESILAKDKAAKLAKIAAMTDEERDEYIKKRRAIALKSHRKNRASRLETNRIKRQQFAWKRSGLTKEQYNGMFLDQGGVCKICKKQKISWTSKHFPLSIDHDHVTGKIRGLLCDNCNVGLGHFKDDIFILKEAIKYLEGQNNG